MSCKNNNDTNCSTNRTKLKSINMNAYMSAFNPCVYTKIYPFNSSTAAIENQNGARYHVNELSYQHRISHSSPN
jgi:hypothetical protein